MKEVLSLQKLRHNKINFGGSKTFLQTKCFQIIKIEGVVRFQISRRYDDRSRTTARSVSKHLVNKLYWIQTNTDNTCFRKPPAYELEHLVVLVLARKIEWFDIRRVPLSQIKKIKCYKTIRSHVMVPLYAGWTEARSMSYPSIHLYTSSKRTKSPWHHFSLSSKRTQADHACAATVYAVQIYEASTVAWLNTIYSYRFSFPCILFHYPSIRFYSHWFLKWSLFSWVKGTKITTKGRILLNQTATSEFTDIFIQCSHDNFSTHLGERNETNFDKRNNPTEISRVLIWLPGLATQKYDISTA